MIVFRLLANTSNVQRLSDGAIIPADSGNADWGAYQSWVSEGGVPLPVEVPSLEARRAAAWERIKAERERRRFNGVFVGGNWFHSNDTSRIQQLGLVIMGANIPPGTLWRTMDNTEVPMSPTLAGGIFQAVAMSDAAHFAAAKVHRAAMELAPDPDAYDFSAGWPASHQGGAS